MKTFALLLAVSTLGLSYAASGFDSDPGYAEPGMPRQGNGNWYGGREFGGPIWQNERGLAPLYYRPTMRYYGNGYTVSYRYIPVYNYSGNQESMRGSTNFRTESFHLSNEEIAAFGVNPPRLTVKDPRSAAPRAPVTTIIRKSTTSTKKSGKGAKTDAAPVDEPAITPSPAPAPATTQSPSPAPAPAPTVQTKP